MSVRHLAVGVCISLCAIAVSSLAEAQEHSIELTSAGAAEISDGGYLHRDEGTSQTACESHDCCATGNCECSHACHGEECCCGHDCGPYWHWTGCVEATYLDPRFHASGNPEADTTLRTIDPGWTAAPRIWLGVENCNGWGSRVRYWQLSDEQSRFDITDFQPGSIFDASQTLKMYDIDLEGTKRMELGCWNLLGSFGGRFGSLERLVSASAFDTSPPADSFVVHLNNQTNAGGITGAVELSRPIGIGCWEVFGLFRGSELWGDTNASFAMRENNNGTPSTNSFSGRFDADLTIWEAQVGLQCSKNVDCWHGTVLARCAFEYQSWNWSVPGGNPGGGAILDPGVELYGVAFAVGFTH